MKKLVIRSLLGVAAAALVFATGEARAAFQDVYDTSLATQTATTWSGTFSVPQFNSALGTLNEVEVWFTTAATASPSLYNGNPFQATVVTSLSAGVNAYAAFNGGPNTLFQNTPVALSVPPPAGGFTIAPGATVNPIPGWTYPAAATLTDYVTYNAGLGYFTGNGNVTMNTSVYGNSSANETGGLFTPTWNTTAGETLEVQYDYTVSPVPEASAVGVMAGVGCLLALVRRMRR